MRVNLKPYLLSAQRFQTRTEANSGILKPTRPQIQSNYDMVRQGKSTPKPKPLPPKSPPTPNIKKIGSLKKFPNHEDANDLLHTIAKLVAPLMHQDNFHVGLLCEMFPKSANLLGLNVNAGAKIMIRLRYDSSPDTFLPITDLIGTMLHELTHNLFGPHDAKFYSKWDELRSRFETIEINGSLKQTGYLCELNKLGGSNKNVLESRVRKLSEIKYTSDVKRLGGTKQSGKSMRELILEATERRAKDSKWCNHGTEHEFDDDDLQIIEVGDFTRNDDKPAGVIEVEKKISKSIEIIELSDEDEPTRKKPTIKKIQKVETKIKTKIEEIIIID